MDRYKVYVILIITCLILLVGYAASEGTLEGAAFCFVILLIGLLNFTE